LELPDRPPSQDELIETEDGVRLLSGFLVRRQADRAASTIEMGITTLRLYFRQ
ncbi:MAG: xanthine permease XanP, partial [Alphaproteobacteria bacterium]|nr:xanthine permease XanP [Alphaproteobacteria bacterium]